MMIADEMAISGWK